MSIGKLLAIKAKLFKAQIKLIRTEYPKSWRFALIDISLGFFSCFFNPYRVCRKRQEIYGETPIETLKVIVEKAKLRSDQTWCELGSGRGKGLFWIQAITGASVIGIEKIPLFWRLSQFLVKVFRVKGTMILADFLKNPLPEADVYYVYSSALSDGEMDLLSANFKQLKDKTVIAISSPLPGLKGRGFPVVFPWGKTRAYIHNI